MDSSTGLVRREILRFLSDGDPEVLCVRGKWGVGKTFSWKRYLTEAHQAGAIAMERYAYVSLFGINSLDELKYSIFENTVRKDIATSEPSFETLKSLVESAEGWGRKTAWVANLVPALSG